MAGRGGLPLGNLPDGAAVAVANNVADGTHVGDATTPEVVPGSDVLTVRGVFSSPIYQIKTAERTRRSPRPPPGAPTGGTIRIGKQDADPDPAGSGGAQGRGRQRGGRRPCCWSAARAPTSGPSSSWTRGTPTSRTRTNSSSRFKMTGGTHTADYLKFSSAGPGVFPPELKRRQLRRPARGVPVLRPPGARDRRRQDLRPGSEAVARPRLSRHPGRLGRHDPTKPTTKTGRRTSPTTSSTSRSRSASTPRPRIPPPAPAPPARSSPTTSIAASMNRRTARRTTGCTTARRTPTRRSSPAPTSTTSGSRRSPGPTAATRTIRRRRCVRVEDNKYDKPETTVFNSDEERMYRRRILRTVIDMRNLG